MNRNENNKGSLADTKNLILEKYGSLENFEKESGAKAIESLENASKTTQKVLENADADKRTQDEVKNLEHILQEFRALGTRIKEGKDTGRKLPSSELRHYRELSTLIDQEGLWEKEKEKNMDTQRKMTQEKIKDIVGIKKMSDRLGEALAEPRAFSEKDNEIVSAPMKETSEGGKRKLHWDGKNVRSPQPGRDIPYEAYVGNYEKPRKALGENSKRTESQGQELEKEELPSSQKVLEQLEEDARTKHHAMMTAPKGSPEREKARLDWLASTKKVAAYQTQLDTPDLTTVKSDGLISHWTEDAKGNRTIHRGSEPDREPEKKEEEAIRSDIENAYRDIPDVKKIKVQSKEVPQEVPKVNVEDQSQKFHTGYRKNLAEKLVHERRQADPEKAWRILNEQRSTELYADAEKDYRTNEQKRARLESIRAELASLQARKEALKNLEQKILASKTPQEKELGSVSAASEKTSQEVPHKALAEEPKETKAPKERSGTMSERSLAILEERKSNHEAQLRDLEKRRLVSSGERTKELSRKILLRKEKISQLDRRTNALKKRLFEISIEKKSLLGRMGARTERAFGRMGDWLKKPENRKALGKRVLWSAAIAGGIGLSGGLLALAGGGGAFAVSGASLATGVGAGVGRSMGAFVGQGVGRKVADHYRKDYRTQMWKERESMRSFQKGLENKDDPRYLERFKDYTERLETIQNKTLKTENRKKFWAGMLGGVIGGLSVRGISGSSLFAMHPNWEDAPGVPDAAEGTITSPEEPVYSDIESVVSETIVAPETPSPDALIRKGEGITHVIRRQLMDNPDLQKAFGINGNPTGAELARIAKDFGYIGEDGSDVRVFMGHNSAYQLWLDEGGNPRLTEFKDGVAGGSYSPGTTFAEQTLDSDEYINRAGGQTGIARDQVNFSAQELYPDIDFESDLNPRVDGLGGASDFHSPDELLVPGQETPTTITNAPEGLAENLSEPKIMLEQNMAGIKVVHLDNGTYEIFGNPDFKYTGDIETKDFSARELKFIERGLDVKGYVPVVSFANELDPPLNHTSVVQLKNGQYAIEKYAFGGSSSDAQATAKNELGRMMKAFGMESRNEHFLAPEQLEGNQFASRVLIPVSEEQAKFIRDNYATLTRALSYPR